MRAGYLKDFVPFPLPFVAGTALSGTIAAVGSGASGFSVGDEVYGSSLFARTGSYGEYTATQPAVIRPKSRALDDVHAAAVPVSGTAAWEAIFGEGMIDPKPGQTILVHGAGGGVGSFAARLAKWRGASVIGTADSGDEGYLHEIGVDRFIDFKKQPFDEVSGKVDAVLDTIGGEVEARSWTVLKPGGVLSSTAAMQLVPPPDAAPGARGAPVNGGNAASKLGEIVRLLDDGIVKVRVGKVLSLADAATAHELAQSGALRGKIVLRVPD